MHQNPHHPPRPVIQKLKPSAPLIAVPLAIRPSTTTAPQARPLHSSGDRDRHPREAQSPTRLQQRINDPQNLGIDTLQISNQQPPPDNSTVAGQSAPLNPPSTTQSHTTPSRNGRDLGTAPHPVRRAIDDKNRITQFQYLQIVPRSTSKPQPENNDVVGKGVSLNPFITTTTNSILSSYQQEDHNLSRPPTDHYPRISARTRDRDRSPLHHTLYQTPPSSPPPPPPPRSRVDSPSHPSSTMSSQPNPPPSRTKRTRISIPTATPSSLETARKARVKRLMEDLEETERAEKLEKRQEKEAVKGKGRQGSGRKEEDEKAKKKFDMVKVDFEEVSKPYDWGSEESVRRRERIFGTNSGAEREDNGEGGSGRDGRGDGRGHAGKGGERSDGRVRNGEGSSKPRRNADVQTGYHHLAPSIDQDEEKYDYEIRTNITAQTKMQPTTTRPPIPQPTQPPRPIVPVIPPSLPSLPSTTSQPTRSSRFPGIPTTQTRARAFSFTPSERALQAQQAARATAKQEEGESRPSDSDEDDDDEWEKPDRWQEERVNGQAPVRAQSFRERMGKWREKYVGL